MDYCKALPDGTMEARELESKMRSQEDMNAAVDMFPDNRKRTQNRLADNIKRLIRRYEIAIRTIAWHSIRKEPLYQCPRHVKTKPPLWQTLSYPYVILRVA